MQIEFIEETKIDGTKRFYTNINGEYVSGTCTPNKEEALKFYEKTVSYRKKNKQHFQESCNILKAIEI